MGFVRADYEVDADVWPENWPAVEIFSLMATQWRSSGGGVFGLDYLVLFQLLDRRYQGDEWWSVFADVTVMEREALRAMH